MTRRIIVYKGRNAHEGTYFVSQEFNGDRAEALRFNPHTSIRISWDEVVSYFNNINSLHDFREVVMRVENMYTYENIKLRRTDKIPHYEEVWMLIEGKLQLYSKHGEVVL